SATAPPLTPTPLLSLHDALPILRVNTLALRKPSPLRIAQPAAAHDASSYAAVSSGRCDSGGSASPAGYVLSACRTPTSLPMKTRSEEHTSELQSRFDLVCRLLLE